MHGPNVRGSNNCSFAIRQSVSDAWKRAVASAVTNPLAHGTTVAELIELLGPVFIETGRCQLCRENVRARIGQATADWSAIKDTI